jgi:hypothetical protein
LTERRRGWYSKRVDVIDHERTAMPQFKVVLDGIELSDEQHARIASRVQQVVLDELAGIDTGGDRLAMLFPKFPGDIGLIARPVTNAEDLQELVEIERREFS